METIVSTRFGARGFRVMEFGAGRLNRSVYSSKEHKSSHSPCVKYGAISDGVFLTNTGNLFPRRYLKDPRFKAWSLFDAASNLLRFTASRNTELLFLSDSMVTTGPFKSNAPAMMFRMVGNLPGPNRWAR